MPGACKRLSSGEQKVVFTYNTGEQTIKNHGLASLFPRLFPGFGLTVNSYPCMPLKRKSLIYQ
jgi:hypothetical protein